MPRSGLDPTTIASLVRGLASGGETTVPVLAPFTGEAIYALPQGSVADVDSAVSAARLAQIGWQALGFAERSRILLAAHDRLLADRETLIAALQSETGKTRGHAFEEVFQAASVTRYYAMTAHRVLARRARRSGIPVAIRTHVSYRPKGVIGIVTPWNYPVSLAAMDAVPALAAGNAVVQKADNQAALSVLATRRAFIDAGVPADVWAVVVGDGEEVGNALVDAADYVCFTGSTPTGARVAARAAARLTGASLELGGKNALLVLDDVDPRKAAKDAVYACFSSLGQLCVSIERIYVHSRVAEEFTRHFVDATRDLVAGTAHDSSTDVGSLTTAAQLGRVKAHVDDAIAKGATVLAGGHALPELGPYFFAPTILSGVTEDMACARAETFGPVVAITVVDSDEEAILAANDTEFGLNASIFSGSVRRARRIAENLTAGSVNINEGFRATFSSNDAPMGGMRKSGLGRRNGPEGILRFVDARTVANATGLITLPRTGREFARLSGVMLLALKVMKALRLP